MSRVWGLSMLLQFPWSEACLCYHIVPGLGLVYNIILSCLATYEWPSTLYSTEYWQTIIKIKVIFIKKGVTLTKVINIQRPICCIISIVLQQHIMLEKAWNTFNVFFFPPLHILLLSCMSDYSQLALTKQRNRKDPLKVFCHIITKWEGEFFFKSLSTEWFVYDWYKVWAPYLD